MYEYIFKIYSVSLSSFDENNSRNLYNFSFSKLSLFALMYNFSNTLFIALIFKTLEYDSSTIFIFGSISNTSKFERINFKQNECIVSIFAIFIFCICLFKKALDLSLSNASYILFKSLSFNSLAEAFVNVTISSLLISTLSSMTRLITLSTSTAVFPLPADADTNILLFLLSIASFCFSVHINFSYYILIINV